MPFRTCGNRVHFISKWTCIYGLWTNEPPSRSSQVVEVKIPHYPHHYWIKWDLSYYISPVKNTAGLYGPTSSTSSSRYPDTGSSRLRGLDAQSCGHLDIDLGPESLHDVLVGAVHHLQQVIDMLPGDDVAVMNRQAGNTLAGQLLQDNVGNPGVQVLEPPSDAGV